MALLGDLRSRMLQDDGGGFEIAHVQAGELALDSPSGRQLIDAAHFNARCAPLLSDGTGPHARALPLSRTREHLSRWSRRKRTRKQSLLLLRLRTMAYVWKGQWQLSTFLIICAPTRNPSV
eukprot:6177054-Pleurochrysis_carterae.AAC.2